MNRVLKIGRFSLWKPLTPAVTLGLGLCVLGVGYADERPQALGKAALSSCVRDNCEIRLSKVVTLVAQSHLLHSPVPYLVQDGQGRFLVRPSNGRQVIVFDSQGLFLSALEAKTQSPRSVISLFQDPRGSVLAWSAPEGQAFRIGADLKLVDWPTPVPYLPSFVRNDGTIVVAQQIRTRELIGAPLHLLGPDGRVLRSFGADTAEYRPDMRLLVERVAAPASDGSVWASAKGRYTLERWNPQTGSRLTRVPVLSPWFTESSNYPSDNKTRPKPVIQSLWERDGVVWALIRDSDAAWKPGADSEQSWSPARYSSSHDWVVEAIDPSTGRVLASSRFDFALTGRPPQPFLISYAVKGGAAVGGGLDIWRPELQLKERR